MAVRCSRPHNLELPSKCRPFPNPKGKGKSFKGKGKGAYEVETDYVYDCNWAQQFNPPRTTTLNRIRASEEGTSER